MKTGDELSSGMSFTPTIIASALTSLRPLIFSPFLGFFGPAGVSITLHLIAGRSPSVDVPLRMIAINMSLSYFMTHLLVVLAS